MNNFQKKFCVTKTENKRNIKRQNEKNLIFERDAVVVKKKVRQLFEKLFERKK